MIDTRFSPDAGAARRLIELEERAGDAARAALEAALAAGRDESLAGATVGAAAAVEIAARFDLASVEELALLGLPIARAMARPPISGYRVGAVGVESASGDLVFGGNVELPGTDLGTTIHAEGFVTLRARRRAQALRVLAVNRARPCAHCRQTLAESAGADDLVLIDLEGHRVRLDDIYPWAFRPDALGMAGDRGETAWPDLGLAGESIPDEVERLLVDAGRRAHAPYSRAPSAAVLRLRDGRLASAGCVESVAFNPSVSAIQAALVEIVAIGIEPAQVTEGWLARTPGGAVDPAPGFVAVLAAVAPGARSRVLDWRGAPADP